jgi:NAD(P)-dependent dehydrogenase (short-subunit alcohol dehydrogenase family)
MTAVVEAVALMAATGAVSGIGEKTALDVVRHVRHRIRVVFGGDERSVNALDVAVADPADEDHIGQLVSALAYYAKRDEAFRDELARWTSDYAPDASVTQTVKAGRDAYTAGRDMTIRQHPTD